MYKENIPNRRNSTRTMDLAANPNAINGTSTRGIIVEIKLILKRASFETYCTTWQFGQVNVRLNVQIFLKVVPQLH